MAEGRRPRAKRRPRGTAPEEESLGAATPASVDKDATERRLGEWFAFGIPGLGVLTASVVGAVGGLGPALLVLAGTALLGTIGFFWASLRTLSGDAPLPEGMLPTALWSRAAPSDKKREVLRALKDLELEHSMGKIDDEDFRELSARYRETAKTLMRALDADLAPRRERAESLARAYLEKRGIDVEAPVGETAPVAVDAPLTPPSRVGCKACGTSNELDAAFCKKCGAGLSPPSATEQVDAPV